MYTFKKKLKFSILVILILFKDYYIIYNERKENVYECN
nr:MAG TPA: hypothetical protein [Caudoviricetes sp.]